MGVVKLACESEEPCELQLVDWIELQDALGMKVAKTYNYSIDLITRQRKRAWIKLGLSDEEIKVLKIIREKHLLYQKLANAEAEYHELKQEYEALKEFLSEEEINEYKERLAQLKHMVKITRMQYKRRVERIEHYRKAIENAFQSFKPMHSLPVVTVKSLLRPVLKDLDLYLLMGMFKTLRLTKEQYEHVIHSYLQMIELVNDIIIDKAIACIEHNECDTQWKLKMKALQFLMVRYPEHMLSAVDLIYDIKDAKPDSELIVHILSS